MRLIQKIKEKLILNFLPSNSKLKEKYLLNKNLRSVRFKGKNILIKKSTKLIRNNGLILGSNISIRGNNILNATAGILIGNNCTIQENVNISTVINKKGEISYKPVIVGSGNVVETDLTPGTILPNKILVKGLSDYKGQIVFILSTGRSGSKAIAHLLNQHPDAECYHDSFPHIYPWSCDFLYNIENSKSLEGKLFTLYNSLEIGRGEVHGQSDQKLAPLVPILSKLFPTAKFIWLIRKADSFVNSSYPRGWFDNSEFGYSSNPKEFSSKKVTPSAFDAAHRTNGILVGAMDEEKWKTITAFERNCWYWSFWNNLIQKNLEQLSKNRFLKVRLDELETRQSDILDFLNLPHINLKPKKINTAQYEKMKREDWNKEMIYIYEKYCAKEMSELFYATD